MTKRERSKRPAALCLAAFAILFWSSTIAAALGSFQDLPAVTKRNQKPGATTVKSGVLIEQFSFLIKDFKIDHQGENNNLNITIWEILNKKITLMVLEKYPAIEKITSQMQ